MPILSLVDVLFSLRNKLRNKIEKLPPVQQKSVLQYTQSSTLSNTPIINSEPKTKKKQYADLLVDLITYISTLESKPPLQIDSHKIPYVNAVKHVEALYTAHEQERMVNDLNSMGLGLGSTNTGKNKSSTNESARNADTTVETDFKIFKWSIEIILAEIEHAITIKESNTFSVAASGELVEEIDHYISETIQILLGATKHYNKSLKEYYDDLKTTFSTKAAIEILRKKFQENFSIGKDIIDRINEISKNSLPVKQHHKYQQLRS